MKSTLFQVLDDGSRGVIHANKEFFERECVLTIAGKYSKNYFVQIQPHQEFEVEITIIAKNGSNITEPFLMEFMNNLIDQQIRIDLQKEFGSLRDKIIDYAFQSVEVRRV